MPTVFWGSRSSAWMPLPARPERKQQRFYKELGKDIAKYEELRIPAIVPVPGIDGSYGMGLSNVKRAVEKAVGADILFSDK